MAEAELERSKNEIDGIVLVGGSTTISKIQRLVKDYFGGNELDIRVKPDEAVVLGAAAALHVHSSDNS
jgi:molecular chaperone DnaK (HSP70)